MGMSNHRQTNDSEKEEGKLEEFVGVVVGVNSKYLG